MRGERHAPPPDVALKNSGGESNRETPHGGGVRRAEKGGGGVNEWNSSRCVTEYYITPSLHTHGARHSHTRGGPRHTLARTDTHLHAPAQRGEEPGTLVMGWARSAWEWGPPPCTFVFPHSRRHSRASVMPTPHAGPVGTLCPPCTQQRFMSRAPGSRTHLHTAAFDMGVSESHRLLSLSPWVSEPLRARDLGSLGPRA